MTPFSGDKVPGRDQRRTEPGADMVIVGRIGKPHGVRGELSVHSHAESPALFDGLAEVHLLDPDGVVQTYPLQSWRPHGRVLLFKLSGVDDRDQAALLTGRDLAVTEADLPELGEDEVYLHDLIGLEVLDQQGNSLGRFDHFVDTAEHEVWVVLHPSGREILLPAVDEVVLEADLAAGTITVNPPEGLLDLYLDETDNQS